MRGSAERMWLQLVPQSPGSFNSEKLFNKDVTYYINEIELGLV